MPVFFCFRWPFMARHRRSTVVAMKSITTGITSEVALHSEPKTETDNPASSNIPEFPSIVTEISVPARRKTQHNKRVASWLIDLPAVLECPDTPVSHISSIHEPPAATPEEPEFTLFPQLPVELRLKIWSMVAPPPRVISIKLNPLRILPITPIPTRATCTESREISSPNLVFFKGVCIDLNKDTFHVPDTDTLNIIIERWPALARQIHSLALEPCGFLTTVRRRYVRYRILEFVRSMGNLEELIVDLGWIQWLPQPVRELREFLEIEKASVVRKAVEENQEPPTWKVPEIPTLPVRENLDSIAFEEEVKEWLEEIGR